MKENLGYGKANNFGILKSTTDYVFILNPDAKLFENTLETSIEKSTSETSVENSILRKIKSK